MADPNLVSQLKKKFGYDDNFWRWFLDRNGDTPALLALPASIVKMNYDAYVKAGSPQAGNTGVQPTDTATPPDPAPASTATAPPSPTDTGTGDTQVWQPGQVVEFRMPDGTPFFRQFKGYTYKYNSITGARIEGSKEPDWFPGEIQAPMIGPKPLSQSDQLAQDKFDYQQAQDRQKAWDASMAAANESEINRLALEEQQRQFEATRQGDLQKSLWAMDREQRDAQDASYWINLGAKSQAGQTPLQVPTPAPANTPSNWIDYWQWQNSSPKETVMPFPGGVNAPVASSPTEAASRGYSSWVTPSDLRTASTQMGVNPERTTMWDPAEQGMRPETDSEYQFRTQTVPLRGIQRGEVSGGSTQFRTTPYAPAMAEWAKNYPEPDPSKVNWTAPTASSDFERSLVNWNNDRKLQEEAQGIINWTPKNLGPVAPAWSKGIVEPTFVSTKNPYDRTFGPRGANPGENQIDISKLNKNSVRPVSSQQWNRMLPSEQQGLAGLAKAAGWDPNDYLANSQNMWNFGNGAPTARKRTAVFA